MAPGDPAYLLLQAAGRQNITAEDLAAKRAELHLDEGLIGDSWKRRRSKTTPDGSPNPLMQLNIMNSRVAALVARDKDRWQLAGDQLYLDLDLSEENMPAGSRQLNAGMCLSPLVVAGRGCASLAAAIRSLPIFLTTRPRIRR